MLPGLTIDQLRTWSRRIVSIPFFGVFALALLMQATKEFYPFSNYPMYSDLTPSVEYYYLSTSRGEAIPQVRFFGFSTSWTKKMLNSRLKKITGGGNIEDATPDQIRQAGEDTLRYLMEHCKEHQKARLISEGLRLHRVLVERSGNRLIRKPWIIAELPGR